MPQHLASKIDIRQTTDFPPMHFCARSLMDGRNVGGLTNILAECRVMTDWERLPHEIQGWNSSSQRRVDHEPLRAHPVDSP